MRIQLTSSHLSLNCIFDSTTKKSHPVAQVSDTEGLEPYHPRWGIVAFISPCFFVPDSRCRKGAHIGHNYQRS